MRTYRVLRCRRDQPGEVVEAGLPYEKARDLAGTLLADEHRAHPLQTSWTIDLFSIELEGVRKYDVLKAPTTSSEPSVVVAGLEHAAARELQGDLARADRNHVYWLRLQET